MQKADKIKEYAKTVLSEKRFVHTVNVAEEAKRLAAVWGADLDGAYLAGVIHDIAKEIPKSQVFDTLAEYGYTPDETEKQNPELLHGKLAAYIAKEKFGIDDEDILSAVAYHTTGRPEMSLLEKIIYVADFTEPGRVYPEANEIRELADKNIDKAVLCQADMVIKFIIDRGRPLHIDTVNTRNYFLLKLKEELKNEGKIAT